MSEIHRPSSPSSMGLIIGLLTIAVLSVTLFKEVKAIRANKRKQDAHGEVVHGK